jgi:hypothetical protein
MHAHRREVVAEGGLKVTAGCCVEWLARVIDPDFAEMPTDVRRFSNPSKGGGIA